MIRKSLTLVSLALATIGAHAAAASYAIDPTHSSAIFEISHFGTSTNRGRFPVKQGIVEFDRTGKTGKVDLTIDVASVDTGVAGLDKHLASPDFFNTAQFPTGKFVADKFNFDGDKVASVSGQLTLLGKTAPITLKATNFNCYTNPMFKREVCGGDFDTTIARSQWGINYGLNYGFPDNVHLIVQVEAIKQQPQ
jgi:polyisoprenoid-binding protein YceI